VKISARGEAEFRLDLCDSSGVPCGRVGSVRTRPAQLGELGAAPSRQGPLGLAWEAVSPAGSGASEVASPKLVELDQLDFERTGDPVADARAAAQSALALLQASLFGEGAEDSPLALLSTRAVATSAEEVPDLLGATILGMLRSAQVEHPGRLVLIDYDGSEASQAAIAAALELSAEEPQLAIREGTLLAPRIEPGAVIGDEMAPGALPAIDPERTVLITDGPGGSGALLATYLSERHGAQHVCLLEHPCDRAGLEAALDSIADERPLGAVIHTAAAFADAAIDSMDADRIERAFAPKLELGWHLHELTKDLDLSAFVLFSSVTGTLGGPGRANQAAASAFLDALARRRRAEGLAAISMAWGAWPREGGVGEEVDETNKMRLRRLGGEALSDEEGLALFELALRTEDALALNVGVDRGSLMTLAEVGALPPILRPLLPRRSGRRAAPALPLAERLASMPEAEREAAVLQLVRAEVAAVLGHSSAEEVPADRPFNELGFDSLAAVEARNRLGLATGMQLPTTAIFDYHTAAALAGYLLAESGDGEKVSTDAELGGLEAALEEIPPGDPRRQGLAAHLRTLAADLEGAPGNAGVDPEIDRLEAASDDELLEFIDEQVGG
jgi:acyl carrier protein